MTTELQAAAAEIEKKMPKRMNEEALEKEAMRIAEASCLHPSDQIMLKGIIKDLAKKYAGEL